MINQIKKAIKQTIIKTKIELVESATFGDFYKFSIIDGRKFTFMLNVEEFINFYAQIEMIQKQRVNRLVEKVNKREENERF